MLTEVDCPRCLRPWAWHEPECPDPPQEPPQGEQMTFDVVAGAEGDDA